MPRPGRSPTTRAAGFYLRGLICWGLALLWGFAALAGGLLGGSLPTFVGVGTLAAIGTIGADEYWSHEPSMDTVEVSDAELTLELQNTRWDEPTHGAVSPFLATWERAYTEKWDAKAPGTFQVKASQGKPKHP